jgi:hypothetical protein
MPSRAKLVAVVAGLVLLGGGLALYKHLRLGMPLSPGEGGIGFAQDGLPRGATGAPGGPGLLVSPLARLPAPEREVFRYVVLIPVGAFVVVVMRNLVGIPTLGTFMPVLFALSLLEIGPGSGLAMFVVVVASGLGFRFLLSQLDLLVVPRVAACVVVVTLLMVVLGSASWHLGVRAGLNVTLFPMIILAWTIERLSLIWEEEGKAGALAQASGSLAVAGVTFLVMASAHVQYLAFHFPELLLLLLAGIILIGRYTGYRLGELVRFRSLQAK